MEHQQQQQTIDLLGKEKLKLQKKVIV